MRDKVVGLIVGLLLGITISIAYASMTRICLVDSSEAPIGTSANPLNVISL